jgi:hypothetical protein
MVNTGTVESLPDIIELFARYFYIYCVFGRIGICRRTVNSKINYESNCILYGEAFLLCNVLLFSS